MTYQPKGSMCMTCVRKNAICKYNFSEMPKLTVHIFPDGRKATIVKCTSFERKKLELDTQ